MDTHRGDTRRAGEEGSSARQHGADATPVALPVGRFRTCGPGIDVDALRDHYTAHRCAQIPQVTDVTALKAAALSAYRRLSDEPLLDAQEHASDDGSLGYGFRFQRLDAKSDSPAHAERVTTVFRELGLLQ
ncbi:hypothetical protein GCM10010269_16060 [Streptomyces humidus]|uniref:Uncharacterized protein n=1 Tax=Streptomyces humidus TaxID=52259 RepID=A0A918L282_9ACTN|nr:hypothetical protein [Streptomyces humidus]GGR77584.1 hypothetical protein GCM10010269_16060 [Streptomyces humidus]